MKVLPIFFYSVAAFGASIPAPAPVKIFSGNISRHNTIPHGRFISEDGNRILIYRSDVKGFTQFYILDRLQNREILVSQDVQTQLPAQGLVRSAILSFSGERAAYIGYFNGRYEETFLYDDKTNKTKNLVAGKLVAFSGDGTAIIFESYEPVGYNQMYLHNVDKGRTIMATRLESGRTPGSEASSTGVSMAYDGKRFTLTSTSWLLNMSRPRRDDWGRKPYYRSVNDQYEDERLEYLGQFVAFDESATVISESGQYVFGITHENGAAVIHRVDWSVGKVEHISLLPKYAANLQFLQPSYDGSLALATVKQAGVPSVVVLDFNQKTMKNLTENVKSFQDFNFCKAQFFRKNTMITMFCTNKNIPEYEVLEMKL